MTMEKKNIDIWEEALRVLYLENSDDTVAEKELARIINGVPAVEMSLGQKAKLFERLSNIETVNTLGKVLAEKMEKSNWNPEQLAQNTSLPLPVIHRLLEDKMYTNNVPVMFMRNLLKQLNISFQEVESSIRKTFALLKEKTSTSGTAYEVNPAFRKGPHTSGMQNTGTLSKGDGRELYENKEALDKYLTRLNKLLMD